MQLPPGPQTPTFVQLMRWIFSPMAFMEDCVHRYGEIFTVKFGNSTPNLVFVSQPQALQQILTQDTKEDFHSPGDLGGLFRPLLGDKSVICLSGEEHQRQLQLMMPSFHGDRMRTYRQVIEQVTTTTFEQLQIGQTFDVRAITQAITLRVIIQAVFGLYEGERAAQLEQFLSQLLELTSSLLSVAMLYLPILRQNFGGLGPWAVQMRYQQAIDALLYTEIQDRRATPDPARTDILNLLMNAQDEAGESMTDVELRDELMTLLVAGHETTATALAWALYWIHKLPSVKERLVTEIEQLGPAPEINTIMKSPYLDAVCNETLRIYPVGMLTFPRVSKKAVNIAGQELASGTIILGSIYLVHHREDLYPQPKAFKPERFLDRQFSPFEFLPFGGGSRRCIDSAFAIFEMKLTLTQILSRWDLALTDQQDIGAKRRGLVTSPERPIQMVVKRKHP